MHTDFRYKVKQAFILLIKINLILHYYLYTNYRQSKNYVLFFIFSTANNVDV